MGRLGTVYADAQCESTCGNNGQVLRSGRDATPVEFGDGVRTGRGSHPAQAKPSEVSSVGFEVGLQGTVTSGGASSA